jgi:hypothetical protein
MRTAVHARSGIRAISDTSGSRVGEPRVHEEIACTIDRKVTVPETATDRQDRSPWMEMTGAWGVTDAEA